MAKKDFSPKCPHCGATIFTVQTEPREINLPNPGRHHGFVYIISGGNGLYKIGKTTDIQSRFKSIKTGNPLAELLHYYETSDCNLMEAALQAKFEDQLVKGEWFALSPEDVAYCCSLKNMIWK